MKTFWYGNIKFLPPSRVSNFPDFFDGSSLPPKYLTPDAEARAHVNPSYIHHQQQDSLIVAWLLASMSAPMLTKMVGLNTSIEIWQKLKIYFASQSRTRIKKLKLQLKNTKNDKSISTYILEIQKTVDSLAAIGSPISDADHIEAILDGLPADYDAFVAWVLSRIDLYSVEEIEALLLAHEERLEKQADSVMQVNASTASWNNNRGSQDRGGRARSRSYSSTRGGRSSTLNNSSHQLWQSSPQSQNNTRLQCQICSKYGHTAPNCWHRFDQKYQPSIHLHNSQVSSSNMDICDQLSSISSMPDLLWYPDSGVSHHITNDPTSYTSKTHYTASELLKLGNVAGLTITHNGSTNLSSLPYSSKFVLNNLFHVPRITKNLLSVSQFAKDNCVFFEFYSHHCNVKHQVTKEILLQGQLKERHLCFSNATKTSISYG